MPKRAIEIMIGDSVRISSPFQKPGVEIDCHAVFVDTGLDVVRDIVADVPMNVRGSFVCDLVKIQKEAEFEGVLHVVGVGIRGENAPFVEGHVER